jgi:hypothetical protein
MSKAPSAELKIAVYHNLYLVTSSPCHNAPRLMIKRGRSLQVALSKVFVFGTQNKRVRIDLRMPDFTLNERSRNFMGVGIVWLCLLLNENSETWVAHEQEWIMNGIKVMIPLA